ncbi:MAG: hypothetical protein ACETWB_04340 [Anaerolineae bacterium]
MSRASVAEREMGKIRFGSVSLSTTWALVGIAALGAALRAYDLVVTQAMIEADEALVGLQAFGILRGERPLFYPAQTYGGSFESYLVALVIWLGGASPWTLKIIPFIFSILFIFMTYQLAKEIYNPAVGLLSALFVALCPLLLIVLGLKTFGGYIQTLVLGNLALILLWRILYEGDGGERIWKLEAALGLVSGFALWVNPQFFYYLLPIGLLLLLIRRTRRGAAEVASFALGFGLGVAPLIVGNLSQSAGRTSGSILDGVVPAKDFWPALKATMAYFVTDSLPTVWGVRPFKGPLTPGPFLLVAPLYLAAIVVEVWRTGRDLLWRRDNPALILIVCLLCTPAIFALGALTNGNFTVIIPDSGILTRYVLPLYTFMPILLAAFLWRLRSLSRWWTVALTLLVLTVNVGGVGMTDLVAQTRSVFVNVPLPASNGALIEALEAEGIRYVYTVHWIGYKLIFETRERVIAFDYMDSLRGMDRLPSYSRRVEEAQLAPAYILFNPRWKRPPPLETRLAELGVSYKKRVLDDFLIYHSLSRKVHPSEVADTLTWPYWG